MNKEHHSAKVQRETALAHLAARPYEKPTAAFTGAALAAAPVKAVKKGIASALSGFLRAMTRRRP